MSTAGVPHGNKQPMPIPLCEVRLQYIENAAGLIQRRVVAIIDAKLAPAYLFIDKRTRMAYVLNDHQGCLQSWLRRRWGDYVGCYSRKSIKGKPSLTPDVDGIAEDIREHLGD